MMQIFRFIGVVAFVACLSVLNVRVEGQNLCAPLGVVNVSINHSAVVHWDPNPNEECEISYYLVYVDSDIGTEYIYAVTRTSLAVDFLPVCDNYIFRIVGITTENVEGSEIRLATKIPLPADYNLTVAMVRVAQQPGNRVFLEWSMDEDWLKCADRFRVIIDDQDIDHLQDIYTFNTSISVPSLAPCTSYEFGIVAIYNWEIEGPVTVVNHRTPEAVQRIPQLNTINIRDTTANLTWNLQPYASNKCPVLHATVDVLNNYNLTVDIFDQTERVPFNVVLPNLQPDSIYLVNVTVVNSAGPSRASLVAIQTIH